MKEIHIRSGVERLNLTAFTMLPVIETICLEGIDPNVIESDWVNLENSNLTILVPEDTSDEQLQAIGQKFLEAYIITDISQVKRGTCSMPDDPITWLWLLQDVWKFRRNFLKRQIWTVQMHGINLFILHCRS